MEDFDSYFKITELEFQLQRATTAYNTLLNHMRNVRVYLEEENVARALDILDVLLGEEE